MWLAGVAHVQSPEPKVQKGFVVGVILRKRILDEFFFFEYLVIVSVWIIFFIFHMIHQEFFTVPYVSLNKKINIKLRCLKTLGKPSSKKKT